jgi:hypothetical protein
MMASKIAALTGATDSGIQQVSHEPISGIGGVPVRDGLLLG